MSHGRAFLDEAHTEAGSSVQSDDVLFHRGSIQLEPNGLLMYEQQLGVLHVKQRLAGSAAS